MAWALNTSDNEPPATTAAEYFLRPGRHGKLARRKRGRITVDLTYGQHSWELPAHRSSLVLVLLLALKDRASELVFELFEPTDQERGFRMRYRIDGAWYDLVPPPAVVGAPMIRELKLLAGRQSWQARFGGFLHSFAKRIERQPESPRSGRFRLRLDNHTIDVTTTVEPTSSEDRVFLCFPDVDPQVSDQAQAQLRAVFSDWDKKGWNHSRPSPEGAAYQGARNEHAE